MAVAYPTELILRDVRCFGGEQRVPLRPITLLVGENSTGKTTLLGCYAALHRMLSSRNIFTFINEPDFNEEPFAMGSFRDIVRSRRGRRGRISEFKLGFGFDAEQSGLAYRELTVTLLESGSQPVVSSLRFEVGDDSYLELQRTESGKCVLESPGVPVRELDVPFGAAGYLLHVLSVDDSHPLRRIPHLKPFFEHPNGPRLGEDEGYGQHGLALPFLPDLIPVAPLRSKPRRTYDPVRETASAEGEHIPMLMMRLDRTSKKDWDSLHDDLVEFGGSAELFSDIKVKRHGKQMSDPFQLQVKVRSGPHANIMDVGYGISQSLPILVDIMAARPGGGTFLLQQPEVHLHPRGQARLASLFVEAFKKRGNRFLIETHSDYIVDRVRIAVRQGKLEPDDVAILYFEPKGNAVNIHSMSVDADGNLLGAPASYREFFLRETDRLLGFAD